MAQTTTGASSTSKKTAQEMRDWFESNKTAIENFERARNSVTTLRDVTKPVGHMHTYAINKEDLKHWMRDVGLHQRRLRDVARYLYYRSNVLFRVVNFYSGMWDLRCRKVTPPFEIGGSNDKTKFLKSFNDTLDVLDRMNLHGNMTELFTNCYVQDVVYAIKFLDKTGMFFYVLDPNDCMIDSRYSTSDFGFAVDMSKWKSAHRQKIIDFLGSPLKEMYEEYERTKVRFIHMPDKYAACFKFRTDTWHTCVPPLLSTFLQLASLEDLVDIQAEADALSIYKLIYLPLKVLSGAKSSDDFQITPDIALQYFDRMLAGGAIPENVGAAVIPGDELKTIDFSHTVDSDTNAVEKASNQVLQTAGGGAVLNANNITSTAAFNAWLKAETEFALSTLLPQVNGWVNRMLSYELKNPAKVEHFEVSIYTKGELAEKMLESCQYGYSNKLAYNTLLGISEKDTLAQNYLEEEVLGLHNIMKYPLSSSFTTSGDAEGGRPESPDDELSESGDRMRNQ